MQQRVADDGGRGARLACGDGYLVRTIFGRQSYPVYSSRAVEIYLSLEQADSELQTKNAKGETHGLVVGS